MRGQLIRRGALLCILLTAIGFGDVAAATSTIAQGVPGAAPAREPQFIFDPTYDYTSVYAEGGRELHHIISPTFDKGDETSSANAEKYMNEVINEFGARGAAAHRSSVTTMDLIAHQYGKTNREANAKLKQALDPNHIIAPGKQGII